MIITHSKERIYPSEIWDHGTKPIEGFDDFINKRDRDLSKILGINNVSVVRSHIEPILAAKIPKSDGRTIDPFVVRLDKYAIESNLSRQDALIKLIESADRAEIFRHEENFSQLISRSTSVGANSNAVSSQNAVKHFDAVAEEMRNVANTMTRFLDKLYDQHTGDADYKLTPDMRSILKETNKAIQAMNAQARFAFGWAAKAGISKSIVEEIFVNPVHSELEQTAKKGRLFSAVAKKMGIGRINNPFEMINVTGKNLVSLLDKSYGLEHTKDA